MTRNALAKKSYTDSGVVFTFSDDGDAVTVDVSQFTPEIVAQLTLYGIAQKIGDAYAGTKTPQEARDEAESMVAQLVAGDWKAARESTGPKAGKTVRALFRIGERDGGAQKQLRKLLGMAKDITWEVSTVRTAVAAQSDDMRKAIAGSQEIKSELATMAAEDAANSGASLLNLGS